MKKKCSPASLTETVLAMQRTGRYRETVLKQCALFVYHTIQRYPQLDEDMKQDFYLSFYPYLMRLTDSFKYRGIPFEAVLRSIMSRRIKSFLRHTLCMRHHWMLCQDESILAMPDTPQYRTLYLPGLATAFGIAQKGKPNPMAAHRVLIAAFRHVYWLSDTDLHDIAKLVGCDSVWFQKAVERLRDSLEPRIRRLKKLSERRNRLFCAARLMEIRLTHELLETNKQILRQLLEKHRRALHNIMRLISRIPLAPTHKTIALVLDIPLGTVNSELSRLPKRISGKENPEFRKTA